MLKTKIRKHLNNQLQVFFEALTDQKDGAVNVEECWDLWNELLENPQKKRRSSAYVQFMKKKHGELRKEHPEWKFGTISKEIGRLWREEQTHPPVIEKKNDKVDDNRKPSPQNFQKTNRVRIHELKKYTEKDTVEDPKKKTLNQKIRDKYRNDSRFDRWMNEYSYNYLCYRTKESADGTVPDFKDWSKEEVMDYYIQQEDEQFRQIKENMRKKVHDARMNPPDKVVYIDEHPAWIMYAYLSNEQMWKLLQVRYPDHPLTDKEDREAILTYFVTQYDLEKSRGREPITVNWFYHEMKRRKVEERIDMLTINFPEFDRNYWEEMEEDELLQFCVEHSNGFVIDPSSTTETKDAKKKKISKNKHLNI